jgi:glycosyltransferase involved in cell wall biosynthesis
MTTPWLSVVIPTRNGERWFGSALQSLVDQEDKGFECIVIDSSSSSATLDIAERFSRKLTISTHRRPDLLSWQEKTNFGVSVARADYICMLHVDDLWLPRRSTAVRRWLQSNPDSVMHLHPSQIVDERGRVLGTWRCPLPINGAAVPSDLLFQRLLVQNFIAVPAPTIKRDAYLGAGGMEAALWYTADWNLYLKLALSGPVHYHAEPLTCFRVHGSSLTMSGSRNTNDFRDQMQEVLDRYADRLRPQHRKAVLRAARASVNINAALASAKNGKPAALISAFISIFGLGPTGMWRYFRDSRLIERVAPRLRAHFSGGLSTAGDSRSEAVKLARES